MRAHLIAVMNPPLVAFLDRTKCDVGEQWRNHSALGRAFARWKKESFFQNAGLQELPNQSRHLQIADARTNALHQQMMIDLIEGILDTLPTITSTAIPVRCGLSGRSIRSRAKP